MRVLCVHEMARVVGGSNNMGQYGYCKCCDDPPESLTDKLNGFRTALANTDIQNTEYGRTSIYLGGVGTLIGGRIAGEAGAAGGGVIGAEAGRVADALAPAYQKYMEYRDLHEKLYGIP